MDNTGELKGIAQSMSEKPKIYKRFSLAQRFEHWTFMASFSILGLTGLIQKYATANLSKLIISGLGGIELVRLIHRGSAFVMMLVTVYHIGVLFYKMYVRRDKLSMLPDLNDLRAAWESALYYIGIRKSPSQQGRYTFEEKAEYWAVVWGTVVMGITGFMMWNPIATARFLPGEFIPAAKAAHSGEALLAILAIILWHFYHVLVKTFNRSMFTGYVTEEQMLHEHPLELADLKAGISLNKIEPQQYNQRMKVFVPVYSIAAAVMLVGIYFFVAYEETALATVPPVETVEVFAPLTPTPLPTRLPTPTPKPTNTPMPESAVPTGVDWSVVGGLFENSCGNCHGANLQLGNANFSSYLDALGSGKSGPAILPNDAEGSQVLIIQTAGGHPGQFTEDEIAVIREWIESGAPEKASPTADSSASASSGTWNKDIGNLLNEKCSNCHGANLQLGNVNFNSFADLMANSGKSGPVVVPGDPDASQLVIIQSAGGHAVQLDTAELEAVISWIKAGAPEE